MTAKRVRSKKKPQNVQNNLKVSDLAPHTVPLPAIPPKTEFTLRVMKRIELTVSNNEGQTTSISPSILSVGVPGGLTYWSTMRVEKLSFWTTTVTTGSLNVEVLGDSSWSLPKRVFSDKGAEASQRPKIGLKLGLLDRARFYSTAATSALCAVGTSEPNIPITVQATVELISGS